MSAAKCTLLIDHLAGSSNRSAQTPALIICAQIGSLTSHKHFRKSLLGRAYRFPLAEAAPIALGTAAEHSRTATSVKLVRFVLFKPGQLEVFRAALRDVAENQR